jgi:hypothetical protein
MSTTATQDQPSRSNGGSPLTPGEVHRVAVPPATRVLSTLPRIDYEDAFLLETGRAQDQSAEQWIRVILEDAPARTRRALRRGWFGLGLGLGSTRDDRLVLGWEVRRSTPDFALLGASSRLGFEARVFLKRQRQSLLLGTLLRFKNPLARTVWAVLAPTHRRYEQHLLKMASSKLVARNGGVTASDPVDRRTRLGLIDGQRLRGSR